MSSGVAKKMVFGRGFSFATPGHEGPRTQHVRLA
jgi:hypothetical protein